MFLRFSTQAYLRNFSHSKCGVFISVKIHTKCGFWHDREALFHLYSDSMGAIFNKRIWNQIQIFFTLDLHGYSTLPQQGQQSFGGWFSTISSNQKKEGHSRFHALA